jgi:cell division septation protein DedD
MSLVWIPATLSVGLLIAALYLGSRILTAHSPAPSPVKTVKTMTTVAPQPAPPPQPKSEPISETNPQPLTPPEELKPDAGDPLPMIAGDQLPMIAPQAGERYIQVAAVATLSVADTRRYIAELRRAKLDPHLAPGPIPELRRVLIGPFATQDALDQTRSDLARAGNKNFVRKY